MFVCALFIVNFPFLSAFLLDTHNLQNAGGQASGQYLTISEFYDEKKLQQHELDKTFALLTSQIELKFTALEQKIVNSSKENDTHIAVLEHQNRVLENNFKALKKQMDLIKANYDVQQLELESMKNDTKELEKQKYKLQERQIRLETKLQEATFGLASQNNELLYLKNETAALRSEMANLMSLKNVQPLKDLHSIQLRVQSISSQVQTLSLNEHARNQDFLALYNETLSAKKSISELRFNTNNRFVQFENTQNSTFVDIQDRILEFYKDQNTSNVDLYSKVDGLKRLENKTEEALSKISEKVVVTACARGTVSYSRGDVVKFDDVRSQTGIKSLSLFQSSGKFSCEKDGLYQLSVTIVANTPEYSIYKNERKFLNTYISDRRSTESGTLVVALNLHVNDTVWIRAESSPLYVYSQWSCITIVKIK